MNAPTAHLGHWVAGLLYLAPVAAVAIALLWQWLRDRADPARGGDGRLHPSGRESALTIEHEEDSTEQT